MTAPGSASITDRKSGGVASLNPRLIACTPIGVLGFSPTGTVVIGSLDRKVRCSKQKNRTLNGSNCLESPVFGLKPETRTKQRASVPEHRPAAAERCPQREPLRQVHSKTVRWVHSSLQRVHSSYGVHSRCEVRSSYSADRIRRNCFHSYCRSFSACSTSSYSIFVCSSCAPGRQQRSSRN